MMQASLHGRLGRDPTNINTKSGTAMTTAPVAVTLDNETLWVRVIGFAKVADALARHVKGEMISASGRVQLSKWTDQTTGQTRENLELIADTVISARTVRPSGGRKREGG